jgi:hypothetical protein
MVLFPAVGFCPSSSKHGSSLAKSVNLPSLVFLAYFWSCMMKMGVCDIWQLNPR